ncbi:hypothetical protein Sjap_019997 [Stephania japonica]|uniref:Serpin domain-containing protein n=1 Tax=Stephania japonica TaxID=461633 RepID=A0AAP0F7A3_9MAGN
MNLSFKRSKMGSSCLKLGELAWSTHANGSSNFVFAPFSIHASLSLLTSGSAGETQCQLLSFPNHNTLAELNASTFQLLDSLKTILENDRDISLCSTNGVWVDWRLPLKHSFKRIANSIYKAEAQAVDFQTKASEAREEINEWIKKETNGLIVTLIPEGAIHDKTALVLANSLYFKGAWTNKFDKSKTKLTEFHLLDGSSVQVPMMTTKEDQYIRAFEDFKVLELPYGPKQMYEKPRFAMSIFLPSNANGLPDLVAKVGSDPNFLEKHLPYRQVEVGRFGVPKFKVSFEFEASDVFKELGLVLPFDKRAEFTEMFESEGTSVWVSGVHHSAVVEVDEEGTEATAASAIVAELQCYTPPTNFVADHPFIFMIRDGVSGAIMFMGCVLNPLLGSE